MLSCRFFPIIFPVVVLSKERVETDLFYHRKASLNAAGVFVFDFFAGIEVSGRRVSRIDDSHPAAKTAV